MTLTDYLLSPDRENAALGLQMAASLLTDEEIFNAVFEAFRVAYDEKCRLKAEYEALKEKERATEGMQKLLFDVIHSSHPFSRSWNIKIMHKFIHLHTDTYTIQALNRGKIYPNLIVSPSDEYDPRKKLLMYCLLSPPTANKYDPRTVQKIGYAFSQNGIVEHESVSKYDELIPGTNFFKVMHKCFCL